MASVRPGALGPFRGKTGDVEIYKVNNKYFGKSARCATTVPATEDKKIQQDKLKLVTKFFKKVTRTLRMGYRIKSKHKGVHAAISDHLNTAVEGTLPNLMLIYPKLQVTKSDNGFHGGFEVSLEALPDAKVRVNWKAPDTVREQYPGVADLDDLVHLTLFNETKQKAFEYFQVAERQAKTVVCDLPYGLEGDLFHAYLFFTSKDGKYVSDSDYAGSFILPR